MPASSLKQKHFMQIALAMKHGHHIEGLSKETRQALHKAAASMTDKQLKDYASKPVKKK